MGRPRKNKVKETVQAIVPVARQVANRRSVNEIIGFKFAKYKTEDEGEYLKSINEMNKIDLQRECIRVERVPSDNRVIMVERLMKDFRSYVASTKMPPSPRPIVISKKSRDILSRGVNPLV